MKRSARRSSCSYTVADIVEMNDKLETQVSLATAKASASTKAVKVVTTTTEKPAIKKAAKVLRTTTTTTATNEPFTSTEYEYFDDMPDTEAPAAAAAA